MSTFPADLKYAQSHEWVRLENENIIRVGITDFAQQQLGDLVFVELPALGRRLNVNEQCAVVESVKTASDLYSPVAGEVVEINADVADDPEKVNNAPYDAWLFCIKAEDLSGFNQLMDAASYQQFIDE